MTFEKWWRENREAIYHYRHKEPHAPGVIRQLFEDAWHDGYKIAWKLSKSKGEQNARITQNILE